MTTSALALDLEVAHLFRASEASLDSSTNELLLHRILPITVCVDVEAEDGRMQANSLGDQIEKEVRRLFDEYGYEVIKQWGPFKGSWYSAWFGRSKQPEDVNALKKNSEGIRTDLIGKIKSLQIQRTSKKLGGISKIGTAVGSIAVVFAGGVAAAPILLHLPLAAFAVLMCGGPVAVIVENAKDLFFGGGPPPKAT